MFKKGRKWPLTPSLFTFNSLLFARRECRIQNIVYVICYRLCLKLVLLTYLLTYNFRNRINSSAVPLVTTALYKILFAIRMLSQFCVE